MQTSTNMKSPVSGPAGTHYTGVPLGKSTQTRPVSIEVKGDAQPDTGQALKGFDPSMTSIAAPESVGLSAAGDGTDTSTRLKGWARFEAWIEQQAHKRPWVQRLCSRIWLPVAFHSGIAMKKLDRNTFSYVLPFKRFNRNWYNAMAGAALVGNSEVAAGMFLFGELGGEWTIVCKQIQYRFLRPCFGPAIYRVVSSDDLKGLVETGREFNINLQMEILQQVDGGAEKEKGRKRRVGACDVTFHCTPKDQTGNRRMLLRRLKEAGAQDKPS